MPVGVSPQRGSPDPYLADVHVQPSLDFCCLTDPSDIARLRDAVRRCVQLFEHPSFSGLLAARVSPTDEDLADDESLDAWLQQKVGVAGHVSVTCKMGPDSNPMAVVDQYCKVHGLQGLRVVDASSMPDIVPGQHKCHHHHDGGAGRRLHTRGPIEACSSKTKAKVYEVVSKCLYGGVQLGCPASQLLLGQHPPATRGG